MMKWNTSAYILQDFVAPSTNGCIGTTADTLSNQLGNKIFIIFFLLPVLSPATHGSFPKKWLIYKSF